MTISLSKVANIKDFSDPDFLNVFNKYDYLGTKQFPQAVEDVSIQNRKTWEIAMAMYSFDKLGVIKAMQGKGLGRKLLLHGIAYSAQKSHTSIALGVDSGNESGAISLYESVGFEPHVVWSAYRLPELL